MLIGLVKWFDKDKGFGVVGTSDGEEYFLHLNSFTTSPDKILKGTPVAFLPKIDKIKNRKSAESSRLVGNPEDWKVILSHLGKADSVRIEVEVTGQGNRGNPYHRKEIQSFSLIELSLKYFFQNKNYEETSNLITNYFDNDLEINQFISYCELIENRLPKHFPNDISTKILNKIFSHFGNNLNEEILFSIWKQKKFKFISYNEMDDYEIPESILRAHILEIGKSELSRILKFSFGADFASYYVNNKFSNIDTLSSSEIKELYQFVDFENETEQDNRKHQLDNVYTQRVEVELTEKANQLDTIRNSDDFNNYNRLLLHIPNQFTDTDKNKVTQSIYKIIAQKCSDEFKPELWIKGLIDDVPFELVSKYFLDKSTLAEKQISILTKLQTEKKFELLKKYTEEYAFEKGFVLLEGLVKKENSLSYYFNLLEFLFDTEYWKDKKSNELIELYTNYVDNHSNDEQKYELFLKGYIRNVPQNIVPNKIHQLEKEDCKKIFKNVSVNKAFILDILTEKVTPENKYSLSWLYDLAIEFLDQEYLKFFDNKVFDTIVQSEYFKFWEIGKAKIFPQHQIEELLQDKFDNYAQIDKWVKSNAITIEEMTEFLFSFLHKQVSVEDRIIFYKQLNHIKYLLQLDELHLKKIKQLQNDFYNVILWVLDKDDILDFELLKQKFIYFAPDEQVRIIRKLFFIKANGQLDLTIEKLNELIRFDLDLYKTNLKFNPEIHIDISTDVVIKALLSYKQNQRFFVESELLTVILNDLNLDKKRRFKLSNYFEKCLGRLTADYDWSRNGAISKVKYGDNKFYFAISFEYDPNLVEAVKSLPARKWNNETKVWGVPSQYEKEVLEFAKLHRFYLDIEGSNYTNNIHLAEFKRTIKGYSEVPNIPNGISFCEGRLANKSHEIFKQEFWWCGGQPCFSKCETIHPTNEWEKYTLLDFCEILGLNTDETNKMGDYIPKGYYYQFIALINRFNRLLEKLYCKDCGHILYPSDFGTGHFAAYSVVRFQCRNNECNNNEEIYLNHCLNGQCNNIIDSRISKRCNNGLFICDNCGSCCSHNMLERRLSNLKQTGGYIHDNLVKCVNEKLGHLERGEYFCYKCKSEMTETSDDIFQCSNCNVEYDTPKYKFKRPHKHLRKAKTMTGINGNNEESNNDDFDFTFEP